MFCGGEDLRCGIYARTVCGSHMQLYTICKERHASVIKRIKSRPWFAVCMCVYWNHMPLRLCMCVSILQKLRLTLKHYVGMVVRCECQIDSMLKPLCHPALTKSDRRC